jgi:hypothetical protein
MLLKNGTYLVFIKAFKVIARAVTAAVVDHDHLNVETVIAVEAAGDGLPEILFSVVRRNNDRDVTHCNESFDSREP